LLREKHALTKLRVELEERKGKLCKSWAPDPKLQEQKGGRKRGNNAPK